MAVLCDIWTGMYRDGWRHIVPEAYSSRGCFAAEPSLYRMLSGTKGLSKSNKTYFEWALIKRRPFRSHACKLKIANDCAACATSSGGNETVQMEKVLSFVQLPSSIYQKAKARGVSLRRTLDGRCFLPAP